MCSCSGKSSKKRQAKKRHAQAERAERCFNRGDYACAMQALEKALKEAPKSAKLWNRLGMASRHRYYQTGDEDFRDQELEAFKKAVKLAPGSARIQINFGTTSWQLGRRKAAAQAYRQALKLQPQHPDATLIRERIQRADQDAQEEDDDSTEDRKLKPIRRAGPPRRPMARPRPMQ